MAGDWALLGQGGFHLIDEVFQFLAGFEVRNLFGGNFDARSGLGIASDARLALAGAEAAESANFDLVTGAKGANDGVKDRLHDHLGVFASHLNHP